MNYHCQLIVPIPCISIKDDQLFWIVYVWMFILLRSRSRSLDLSFSIVSLRNGTINECTEWNRAKKMTWNYLLINMNIMSFWRHVDIYILQIKNNEVVFFSKSSKINVLSVLESLIHSSATPFRWCGARFYDQPFFFARDEKNVHLSPTRQFHIFNEFFNLPGHRLHQMISDEKKGMNCNAIIFVFSSNQF